MELSIYEIIGYTASGIIALSMTMSSIVKFRWINLVGASIFATYGILIGALPVAILNGLIVAIDIYYLLRIYGKKELFETLEVRKDNRYLLRFLEFHHDEIQKFCIGTDLHAIHDRVLSSREGNTEGIAHTACFREERAADSRVDELISGLKFKKG